FRIAFGLQKGVNVGCFKLVSVVKQLHRVESHTVIKMLACYLRILPVDSGKSDWPQERMASHSSYGRSLSRKGAASPFRKASTRLPETSRNSRSTANLSSTIGIQRRPCASFSEMRNSFSAEVVA